MNSSLIKENWRSRGYSFGVFQDPPKQVWANFVHKTDELVVLTEGEIEIEIEGKVHQPRIGEEVFITARTSHTVRNKGMSMVSAKAEWEEGNGEYLLHD